MPAESPGVERTLAIVIIHYTLNHYLYAIQTYIVYTLYGFIFNV